MSSRLSQKSPSGSHQVFDCQTGRTSRVRNAYRLRTQAERIPQRILRHARTRQRIVETRTPGPPTESHHRSLSQQPPPTSRPQMSGTDDDLTPHRRTGTEPTLRAPGVRRRGAHDASAANTSASAANTSPARINVATHTCAADAHSRMRRHRPLGACAPPSRVSRSREADDDHLAPAEAPSPRVRRHAAAATGIAARRTMGPLARARPTRPPSARSRRGRDVRHPSARTTRSSRTRATDACTAPVLHHCTGAPERSHRNACFPRRRAAIARCSNTVR